MNLNFAQKLDFYIQKTSIGSQKINNFILETFEMVIADFQLEDKANKPIFFQEIFLVADIKFELILKMLFLKINNTDVLFSKEICM